MALVNMKRLLIQRFPKEKGISMTMTGIKHNLKLAGIRMV